MSREGGRGVLEALGPDPPRSLTASAMTRRGLQGRFGCCCDVSALHSRVFTVRRRGSRGEEAGDLIFDCCPLTGTRQSSGWPASLPVAVVDLRISILLAADLHQLRIVDRDAPQQGVHSLLHFVVAGDGVAEQGAVVDQ